MRLIDADALKNTHKMSDECDKCETKWKECQYDYIYSKMDFCTWIDDAPTIEPEQKKGEWLMDGEKCGELMWRCSECGVSEAVPTATSFISGIAYPQWKFCPNCGADMREGESNEID